MANLFWVSAAQVVKDLGDGPHSAATLLAQYNWTFARADASTCATYIDKTGTLQTAAANFLRIEYVDLDGDGIRETPGLLLEGSRIQLVTDHENFNNWTVQGVVARTSGQPDPFGGTGAYLLDSNTPGAADAIYQVVAFTADGTKNILGHVKAGTATQSAISVHDITASVQRHRVLINWAAGVPTLAENGEGTGTKWAVKPLSGGWYQISINADSVVAANTNRYYLHPDFTGAGGTVFFFGANARNAVFPDSYIRGASAVTRAADSLTLPFNFGPIDLTTLFRIARPVWADAVGTIGLFPGVMMLGGSPPRLRHNGDTSVRQIYAEMDTTGTDASVAGVIPAGASITMASQFRLLTTGGKSKADIGSGFGSESGAASGFSAFGSQVLTVGSIGGGSELYGVLIDLKGRQGLITLASMLTEPGFAPVNPFEVTDFVAPGPLISKAQSGRVNLRSTQQLGMTWTERYLLKVSDATHREFLARMSQLWGNGTIFTKGHVDYATPKGSGGGVPLVKGASQTGSTLIVDGCPLNTANWLRAGDIFRVQGLPRVFVCAADVNTEGDGRALIQLTRPIFTGGSPSDNATLTITGVTLDVVLLEPPDVPTTSGTGADWGELVLKLSESL